MITMVAEGSPAAKAGLAVGDLISEMGPVNVYSVDWREQLPTVVKEGVSMSVVVMRKTPKTEEGQKSLFLLKDGHHYLKIMLQLTPARWEGRGLLGCILDEPTLRASTP